jgi:translation initiation factor IF-3
MVLAPHRGAKTRAKALHPEEQRDEPAPETDTAEGTTPSPNCPNDNSENRRSR